MLKAQARAELMERRLTAASKLIIGLASERTRWTADMQVTGCAHFLTACMQGSCGVLIKVSSSSKSC